MILIYKSTARPRIRAPATVDMTPIFLASTACPALSDELAIVGLPPVSAAVLSLLPPVGAGVASSPYSEVMEARTLLRVGSAKTAEET